MKSLRVCSWNVHECVGSDGRRDVHRIATVLREIAADAVGLQEVHADPRRGPAHDQARYLSEATGLTCFEGTTLERRGGRYGNLVLTRLPVNGVRRHDLSVPGREPRGALEIALDGSRRVCFVTAHLGLGLRERAWQAASLLGRLDRAAPDVLVVAADWNEWVPWGRSLRLARRRFGRQPAPPTFPAGRPVFALDRIFVSPRHSLVRTWIHLSAAHSRASDHLPLVADVSPLRAGAVDEPAV
jgi:endonuclease/exonuclease/phosphatase family metal-dependent hydrolase